LTNEKGGWGELLLLGRGFYMVCIGWLLVVGRVVPSSPTQKGNANAKRAR